MADALPEILRAASKHPSSRVSKLIQLVEEERSQKNIVLLLIELAEHAEYSIDFNVSLRYYLNLFESLGINHDLVLNEAGLLLVNSSKIYSKRVDYVQSLVERQILTLSNADDELQKQQLQQQQNENATPAEKTKRGRKRALEASTDPYEIELAPKKFKKLTEEKRFAALKTVAKPKSVLRNIEMEQHIHPACWQYATIHDFENEEDVDTKRNYKLFTYHVEHRYNTLVPDINFRLHFKVKDYMDELEEEMEENKDCNTDSSWPPLSEAYIEKYLRLENYVLQQDMKRNKRSLNDLQHDVNTSGKNESISFKNNTEWDDSTLNSSAINTISELSLLNKTQTDLGSSTVKESNDSGLGQSMLDETNKTLNSNLHNCSSENSTITDELNLNVTQDNKTPSANESQIGNDSAVGTSVLDQSGGNMENNKIENLIINENKEILNASDLKEVNSSLNVANNQLENDSALGASVLDQTNNIEDNTAATESPSGNLESNTTENNSHNVIKSDLANPETSEESKLTDNGKYSDSSPERIMATEHPNPINSATGNGFKIDVLQQQDKKTTQIRVQLPNGDDEGVYLSDLEEQYDSRLLLSVVNINNILPGVERKDITIVLDEELRQALEMRDGIMKHFGRETFTVPVITEAKKTNLVFNILKLPEKILRRKVLFKLGPEMDVYLQARSLKRSKAEHATRQHRRGQSMQWFSLNNTDMTDVVMSTPYSPDHCSNFCGFAEDEGNDSDSCAEFCGFTEEEQSKLTLKAVCRLSRDSGVGGDVNNITPEKEVLDIKFEDTENVDLGTCNKNLNNTESLDTLLTQLPSEIRDVLTTELEKHTEPGETATENESKSNEDLSSANNTDEMKESGIAMTENSSVNNTKDCSENTENVSSSQNALAEKTQTSDLVLTENSNENRTCTEEGVISDKTIAASESQPKLGDCGNENELLSQLDLQNQQDDVESSDCDDYVMLDLDTQGNKTKIQQWHEHLQPILAKSRERHHFDIYKLGTELIETVQHRESEVTTPDATSSNQMTSLDDVMQNKDKSYVSRYFLSTLLLANQSNIEIVIENKSSERPTAWHDINLKLLSTKRHTVAIEDNIGMIDSKQKTREHVNVQQKTKTKQNSRMHNHQDEDSDEDDLLRKLQISEKSSKKIKTSLKRSSSDDRTTACIADKKPRETLLASSTINSRHKALPNLIESVQIIKPAFSNASVTMDTSILPSTSHHAQKANSAASFNININAIRTLQPIEKVQKSSDDIDSGIFSTDEIPTS